MVRHYSAVSLTIFVKINQITSAAEIKMERDARGRIQAGSPKANVTTSNHEGVNVDEKYNLDNQQLPSAAWMSS